MVDGDVKVDSGRVIFCGSTKWDLIGRSQVPISVKSRGGSERGEEILTPSLITMETPKDAFFSGVYSGPCSAHAILIDSDGNAWGIGRNDNGQLAHASLARCDAPSQLVLPVAYKSEKIVSASCGRTHTLMLTDEGNVFACGSNLEGQLGIGGALDPDICSLKKVQVTEKIVDISAGGEFSVFVGESGAVYSAGSGQYGQLGIGKTGERILTGNKTAFLKQSTPTRVAIFGKQDSDGEVLAKKVACGGNHALVLDDNGKVWSWGFGGYGRLGHREPRDVLIPKQIEAFTTRSHIKIDLIAAGNSASFASQSSSKTLWMWGITKKTGESNMYPKPIYDLQGWTTRSIACGISSTVVAADETVISWGPSPAFGELGYGEKGSKSNTKPQKMDALDGSHVYQVAMGQCFTLLLIRDESEQDRKRIASLPKLELIASPTQSQKTNATSATKTKAAPAKARGKKRKA